MRNLFFKTIFLLLACDVSFAHFIPFAFLKTTAQLDPNWTPQWSSLKAYWKMNGVQGAIASGYVLTDYFGTSDATSSGTGLSFVAGKLSDGISFDGTNSLTIPNTAPANVCTAMTVMLWVKFNAPASPGWSALMSSWNGCNTSLAGWNIVQNGSTKGLQWSVNTSATANSAATTSTTTALDGSWHHVAVTVTAAGVAKIYVDGTFDGTTTFNMGTGLCTTTTTTTVGGSRCSNGLGSGAILDELAIWNTTLTQTEVQTIYNRQVNSNY